MKILSKLSVQGRMLLTLDGDILGVDASRVLVDGKEFDFDIAFDMKNTIGIKTDSVVEDVVEFVGM